MTTQAKLQFGRTVWCLTCYGLVHEWLDLGIWSSVLTLVSAILLQYCWNMWSLYLVLTSVGMVPISLVNIPTWSWVLGIFPKQFISAWSSYCVQGLFLPGMRQVYRLGIEIDIKLIQGWYWLVSLLLGLSWYKTGLPEVIPVWY